MINTNYYDNGGFFLKVTQPKYMCPDYNDVVFKIAMKHYSTDYPAVASLMYVMDY